MLTWKIYFEDDKAALLVSFFYVRASKEQWCTPVVQCMLIGEVKANEFCHGLIERSIFCTLIPNDPIKVSLVWICPCFFCLFFSINLASQTKTLQPINLTFGLIWGHFNAALPSKYMLSYVNIYIVLRKIVSCKHATFMLSLYQSDNVQI